MNKRIIWLIVAGFIVVIGIFIVAELLSYRTVRFNLAGDGYSIVVRKDEEDITTISGSQDVRLKEGEYSYSVTGERFDTSTETFTVTNEPLTISVNPDYSTEYLSSLAIEERPAAEQLLQSTYSSVEGGFRITSFSLYEKGEWAGGIVQQNVDPRMIADSYRFILKKEEGTWKIVIPPQIAIKATEYKDVPREVLDALY